MFFSIALSLAYDTAHCTMVALFRDPDIPESEPMNGLICDPTAAWIVRLPVIECRDGVACTFQLARKPVS